MNDLSGTGDGATTSDLKLCEQIPAWIPCVLAPLLLAGTAISLFILVVVHNAFFLVALLLLSSLVVSFLLWNFFSLRRNLAFVLFVDRLPVSDLTASDGQLVKITGTAECGEILLESPYEKVERCVYTSTLLYEYNIFGFKFSSNNFHTVSRAARAADKYFFWKLTYMKRFAVDFYITDAKSGIRALVKAGYDSKVIPLISENVVVNMKNKNREMSSTLKKWLEERSLPMEARLVRLEEGFIMERACLTVVGTLSKRNDTLMIVPPQDTISTSCLLQKLLLPVGIDGLILRYSD